MNSVLKHPLSWIVLSGFVIRFIGVQFGLPDLTHADEPMMIHHAVSYAGGDFNPHYFKLPPLLSYLLFGVYGIYFVFGTLFGAFDSLRAFEELFINNPTSFYLIGRLLFGVFLGTASIYLVYRLVMRVLNQSSVALLSSFFLAFSFLHVIHSHYVYHDIPMIFFILLTVWKSVELYQEPKLSHYLWAAFFGGLASGFKYNAALLSLSIFLAHLLKKEKVKEEKYSFRAVFLDKKLYLAAGVMILTYLLTNPFSVISFSEFARELGEQFAAEDRFPFFYHLSYSLAEGIGKPLLVLSLVGLFMFLLQHRKMGLVLFSFPLIFYVFCMVVSQPHERYMLPLIPFLSISAAWAIRAVKLHYLIAALVVAPTFIKSLYVDSMLLKKDTRAQAREWIEENIPQGSSIALDHTFFLPRLLHHAEQLEEKRFDARSSLQKRRIDVMLAQSRRKPSFHLFYLLMPGDSGEQFLFSRPTLPKRWKELKEKGIQVLIVHRREEDFSDFYLNLDKYVTLLKTFSPYRDSKKIYSVESLINTAIPFLSEEIYSRVRAGYTIQIYRLR